MFTLSNKKKGEGDKTPRENKCVEKMKRLMFISDVCLFVFLRICRTVVQLHNVICNVSIFAFTRRAYKVILTFKLNYLVFDSCALIHHP